MTVKREPQATDDTPTGRISFSTRFNKIRIFKLKENHGKKVFFFFKDKKYIILFQSKFFQVFKI